MNLRKKALLVVQGINTDREYIKPKGAVIEQFFKKYDDVEYVYTEDVFDKSWFSKLFDKFDFIPYFLSEKRRIEVCRAVNEKIKTFELLGYDIDVLAHSLGCVIALQSGRKDFPITIGTLIALQPPTNNKVYGWYVRSQVIKYSADITINKLLVTWNEEDTVAADSYINLKEMMYMFKGVVRLATQYRAGVGHDWRLALKQLITYGGLFR